FNAEDYANDQEAPLEELFDHLDHFINYFQYDNINIDQFLPAGATLIKRDKNPPRGKSIEGIEYSISPDTDFHKWYKNSENRREHPITAGKDQSIKEPRPNQKLSKKCDCKSRIIVANTNTPNGKQMIIKYTPHTNHIPGSENDISILRLSKEIRNWITEHIRDGLNVKRINRLFQKNKTNAIIIKDNLVTCDDIYNIWKEAIVNNQMKHKSEAQSIELWRIELNQKNDLTCTIPKAEEKTQSLGRKLTSDEKRSLENEYGNLNGIDKIMWIKAYRTRIPRTNMDMTNMLESWHKRLKYDNFEGKVNRRIDVLIYELYIVIDGDTQQQWRLADPQQQVPTPEELIYNIHEMTQNLNDLDVNSLQVVRNQLSRVLEDVHRPDRTFQEGDWVNDQNIKFLPNVSIERQ
ncbi:33507_t:CDS:2, partial [Racocetra persica]